MASKPTKPDWIPDDTTGIIVPSGSKQSTGWAKTERPPYEFFNWFFNLVSQFIDYFSGEAEYNIIIDSDTDEGDYATLAAYILAGSTPGDRVFLKVDEEITGATMVIPANILLKQEKGKKLWCDEIALTTALQFSDGVVTEGDLLLELSHTGTLPTAVSFNGDDNNHCNIIVKNTAAETITNAFKIESGKNGNLVKGEVLNPSGTVTSPLVNSAIDVESNDVTIRISGGDIWGTKRPRAATGSQGGSPAPDVYGGGTIWVEERIAWDTGSRILDNGIDWKDRFLSITGFAIENTTSILPGSAGDNGINGFTENDPAALDDVHVNFVNAFLYTEAGGDGSTNPRVMVRPENGTGDGYIFVDSVASELKYREEIPSNGGRGIDLILKIDYSPKQNHY